jgi:hypothetical protein
MKEPNEIPLVDAAYRLQERYGRALNRVLAGQLRGRKVRGHWVVDVASIDELKATRAGASK